ncbi:hypothetical protein DIPPA_12901 [Diplonema papillatum]|nr:hypothetical protein DIPPA_12901 [Diplonema papillatum]
MRKSLADVASAASAALGRKVKLVDGAAGANPSVRGLFKRIAELKADAKRGGSPALDGASAQLSAALQKQQAAGDPSLHVLQAWRLARATLTDSLTVLLDRATVPLSTAPQGGLAACAVLAFVFQHVPCPVRQALLEDVEISGFPPLFASAATFDPKTDDQKAALRCFSASVVRIIGSILEVVDDRVSNLCYFTDPLFNGAFGAIVHRSLGAYPSGETVQYAFETMSRFVAVACTSDDLYEEFLSDASPAVLAHMPAHPAAVLSFVARVAGCGAAAVARAVEAQFLGPAMSLTAQAMGPVLAIVAHLSVSAPQRLPESCFTLALDVLEQRASFPELVDPRCVFAAASLCAAVTLPPAVLHRRAAFARVVSAQHLARPAQFLALPAAVRTALLVLVVRSGVRPCAGGIRGALACLDSLYPELKHEDTARRLAGAAAPPAGAAAPTADPAQLLLPAVLGAADEAGGGDSSLVCEFAAAVAGLLRCEAVRYRDRDCGGGGSPGFPAGAGIPPQEASSPGIPTAGVAAFPSNGAETLVHQVDNDTRSPSGSPAFPSNRAEPLVRRVENDTCSPSGFAALHLNGGETSVHHLGESDTRLPGASAASALPLFAAAWHPFDPAHDFGGGRCFPWKAVEGCCRLSLLPLVQRPAADLRDAIAAAVYRRDRAARAAAAIETAWRAARCRRNVRRALRHHAAVRAAVKLQAAARRRRAVVLFGRVRGARRALVSFEARRRGRVLDRETLASIRLWRAAAALRLLDPRPLLNEECLHRTHLAHLASFAAATAARHHALAWACSAALALARDEYSWGAPFALPPPCSSPATDGHQPPSDDAPLAERLRAHGGVFDTAAWCSAAAAPVEEEEGCSDGVDFATGSWTGGPRRASAPTGWGALPPPGLAACSVTAGSRAVGEERCSEGVVFATGSWTGGPRRASSPTGWGALPQQAATVLPPPGAAELAASSVAADDLSVAPGARGAATVCPTGQRHCICVVALPRYLPRAALYHARLEPSGRDTVAPLFAAPQACAARSAAGALLAAPLPSCGGVRRPRAPTHDWLRDTSTRPTTTGGSLEHHPFPGRLAAVPLAPAAAYPPEVHVQVQCCRFSRACFEEQTAWFAGIARAWADALPYLEHLRGQQAERIEFFAGAVRARDSDVVHECRAGYAEMFERLTEIRCRRLAAAEEPARLAVAAGERALQRFIQASFVASEEATARTLVRRAYAADLTRKVRRWNMSYCVSRAAAAAALAVVALETAVSRRTLPPNAASLRRSGANAPPSVRPVAAPGAPAAEKMALLEAFGCAARSAAAAALLAAAAAAASTFPALPPPLRLQPPSTLLRPPLLAPLQPAGSDRRFLVDSSDDSTWLNLRLCSHPPAAAPLQGSAFRLARCRHGPRRRQL